MSRVDPLRASLNAYFEKPLISKSTRTHSSGLSYPIDVDAAQTRPYSPYSNSTYSPSSTVYSSHTLVPPNDHARTLFESASTERCFIKEVDSHPYTHPFTPIGDEFPVKDYQKVATTPMQRDYISIPPAAPLTVGARLSSKKLWTDSFETGSRVQNPDVSLQYASSVIRCGYAWDHDQIGDLVRSFVWNASTSLADGHDALAMFAQRVHISFSRLSPNGVGESFKFTLRATVLGTFNASWNGETQRNVILYEIMPSESHTKRVSSALSLCNFIGAMYRSRFLERADIQACICVLMNNMSVLEHLCAIRNILLHAGTRYWEDAGLRFDDEVRTLSAELIQISKRCGLTYNRAVLPLKDLPFPTVGEGIRIIVEYIKECKIFVDNKALGTQKTLVRGRDIYV